MNNSNQSSTTTENRNDQTHHRAPANETSRAGRIRQAQLETNQWMQRTNYRLTPEDINTAKQTAQEYKVFSSKFWLTNAAVGMLLTTRFRYGPGEYYSPISGAFAKMIQRLRFVNPPRNGFYSTTVWGCVIVFALRESYEARHELVVKHFSQTQSPYGAEFRKQ
jgi:hypothetical protein